MKNKIAIIGAGGHGRVCAEIAELNGYEKIVFLDDNKKGKPNVFASTDDLSVFLNEYDFFVAIGNNALRKNFYNRIKELNGTIATLIHPQSVISKKALIGEGSVIMAGVVINTGANIGHSVIINTCSSIDHDCNINDYSHVGVGAHLAGTVEIGENSFVGAGSTIINNISVCSNVIVGAGAVVVSDIEKAGTYIGVPAKYLFR